MRNLCKRVCGGAAAPARPHPGIGLSPGGRAFGAVVLRRHQTQQLLTAEAGLQALDEAGQAFMVGRGCREQFGVWRIPTCDVVGMQPPVERGRRQRFASGWQCLKADRFVPMECQDTRIQIRQTVHRGELLARVTVDSRCHVTSFHGPAQPFAACAGFTGVLGLWRQRRHTARRRCCGHDGGCASAGIGRCGGAGAKLCCWR